MNKFYLLIALCAISKISYGQASNEKIMYVVDSIPVIKDPEKEDEITQYDVSDIKVITNSDTIKLLGYGAFDRVILLFTKEYRNRPQHIKQIPSTKQMERKMIFGFITIVLTLGNLLITIIVEENKVRGHS